VRDALGPLGIVVVVVRGVGPRKLVGGDVTNATQIPRHLREHAALVVPIERGNHGPVGALRVEVERVDLRHALEVALRGLRLPCRDRRLVFGSRS